MPSMKTLNLLTLLFIQSAALRANLIEQISAPARLEAGKAAVIRITAAPGRKPITLTCSLTGQSTVLQPGNRFYSAAGFHPANLREQSDAEAITGSSVTGNAYATLFLAPFPRDGKYYVWARVKGGNLCLKGRSGKNVKEIKWNWGKAEKYQWRNFGCFDAAAIGDDFLFMTEQKPPFAQLDAVLLSPVAPDVFSPTKLTAEPGCFTWETDSSSIGYHRGTITAVTPSKTKEVKTFTIEITAKPTTKEAQIVTTAGSAVPLPLPSTAITAADYPLFKLPATELKPILASSGIAFPNDGRIIALRCNKYKDLPAEITIPVKGIYSGLAFLLSEYWQGEVGQEMATITVVYADGSTVAIPLREEYELAGSLRDPKPKNALHLGNLWNGSTELHVSLLPWANPHPERRIEKLLLTNLRRVFSPDENKMIPLNVTAESSQLILGLAGLDAAKLNAIRARLEKTEKAGSELRATVDYAQITETISPLLFGTNETGILNTANAGFATYLELMKTIDCRIFRIHSGWSLEAIYPNGLKNPQYDLLVAGLAKLRGSSPQWQVMMCLNRIPQYVDPKTEAGRQRFAELAADLVRELNIKRRLGIAYWEIYNEVYFKELDADRALWQMYNLAAEAMKKVDPSIKIGGYAPCWPSFDKIRDFYRHCHRNTDFISWHKYLTGSVKTPDAYLMDKAATFGTDAAVIRRIAEEITPGKKIELALTEFNINWNWKPHDPRQANHIGSAWFAAVFINLIHNRVDIAQNWHSRQGGTFGMIGENGEIRPVARLYYLTNRYLAGGKAVATTVATRRFDCLGFTDRSGKPGLLLVNHEAVTLQVRVSLLNMSPAAAAPFEGNTREYSLSESGYEISDSEMLSRSVLDLSLRPFEVKLLTSTK